MNDNSSPEPDGFGPAFFKKNWDLVKLNLLDSLSSFHNLSSDLRPINKSHIILLPKKEGANKPDNFRPISLQNCCLKVHTNVLLSGSGTSSPTLFTLTRLGLLRGDLSNFFYAADIVQSYHKRAALADVFKLDFRKAFESISWDALDRILLAKGFPELWRTWIKMPNQTSQTAVLLNGVPGRWIQCRRGLRQGDPLSPFLFNIIIDILQQMMIWQRCPIFR
jgi:mannosylglycoprotein endo-beta-mannosidase